MGDEPPPKVEESSSIQSTETDCSYLPHGGLDKFLRMENVHKESKGIRPRTLGVRFKGVTTWGVATAEAEGVNTFAKALKRTLTARNLYDWLIYPLFRKANKPRIALIRDVSGLVRDGEMMLVLGRPGSGCTTFLRTVTSNHTSYLGIDGRISYSGGLTPHDIQTRYRADVSYMPEEDIHLPYLTVRQTLDFAFRCRLDSSQLVASYVSTLARVFGISHVLDSVVGNEHIRGISGGERKRLSCIETLATNAMVVAWDGSTRGLDAATTLGYAQSLRVFTNVGRKATIVSLYQVSEEVWQLMDKVILLAEGRVIFSGPINEAKKYFVEELGYACTGRRTTADFLISITNPAERCFRPGLENCAPKGPVELEKAFRESRHYQALMQEVDAASEEFGDNDSTLKRRGGCNLVKKDSSSNSAPHQHTGTIPQKAKDTRPQSSYKISFPMQVLVCLKRQSLYLCNNISAFVIRLMNNIANALIMGSLFWAQPPTSDGAFSRGGLIFYASILLGWIQMAELEDALSGREVIERHRSFRFVRPSAVSVARMILDIPIVLFQVVVFAIIVYWMAGMKDTGGAFMTFFVLLYILTLEFTALYRLFAAISKTYEVAIRYCGLTILIYIIFGGYTLSVDAMMRESPWFGWLAYINPVYYTFAALMSIEFHTLSLNCTGSSVIPNGPMYTDPRYQSCVLPGSLPSNLTTLGDNYIQQAFGYRYKDVWINFYIVLVITVGLYIGDAVATELIRWDRITAEGLVFKKAPRKIKRDMDVEGLSVEASIISAQDIALANKPEGNCEQQLQKNMAIFTWKDVSYSIPAKVGGSKRILNSVEGICRPGEMTALVGISGAGKTTLLSVLSRRAQIGTTTGSILINGHPLPLGFERSTGLCEQMDLHDPSSTIREAFVFSALLRQDSSIPWEDKSAYVDTVLHMLELTHLSDALICSLSLEQKKRTTIGVELCARPKLLLFLDEPTSGLDSQGAYNIVKLLRKLVDLTGQSVLCTVHQASQQILEMFDAVLALNPGGNTFYCGPVGKEGEEILKYFKARGVHPPEGKNVADLLIEVGKGLTRGDFSENNTTEDEWSDIWRGSDERQVLLCSIADSCAPKTEISEPFPNIFTTTESPTSEYASSALAQTKLLAIRLARQFWRTPEYPYSRLFASVVHPILIGFTFFQLGNSLFDLQARAFSIFLVLMIVPEIVYAVSFRFSLNIALFRDRELPARIYSPLAFALANIVSELPYIVLNSFIYWAVWYWAVGFPVEAGSAGYTMIMILTFHAFSTGWGQWLSALVPNYTITANLIPFFIIMCECFNGILRPWNQLPVFWRYGMYTINPMTYFVRGMLSATMAGNPVSCSRPGEVNVFQPPPGTTCGQYTSAWFLTGGTTGYILNPGDTHDCGYCKYKVVEEYLESLNVHPGEKWRDLAIFITFTLGNWVLVVLFVCSSRGEGVSGVCRRVKRWCTRQ